MSDSVKKWEELEEANEKRQRVVGQNGPSALHYESNSTADFITVESGCPTHNVEEGEDVGEVKTTPNFKKITDSIADLLKYKNIKYGNAALEPMDIFQGKCKVGQRLDDKIARVKNGGELQKNDIADLIGYLTLVCVEKGWDNFEEFKD